MGYMKQNDKIVTNKCKSVKVARGGETFEYQS